MARKANNPTLVMLVQQIKAECWQHSRDPAFADLLEQAHAANCLPKGDPTRVDALLAELDYEGTHLAVAVNYDVVPRARWADTVLNDNDAVEILTPRQGG